MLRFTQEHLLGTTLEKSKRYLLKDLMNLWKELLHLKMSWRTLIKYCYCEYYNNLVHPTNPPHHSSCYQQFFYYSQKISRLPTHSAGQYKVDFLSLQNEAEVTSKNHRSSCTHS